MQNYYYNYNIGLIDGLLVRLGIENYVIKTGDPAWEYSIAGEARYSRYLKQNVKRLNVIEKNKFVDGAKTERSRNIGDKTMSHAEYLFTYLMKKDMIPMTDKEIDWNKEFDSPFPTKINQLILILKWIAGIQSITKQTVILTKEDFQKIEFDHLPLYKIKEAFDSIFYNSIVTSSYEDGKWSIKLGSRDLLLGEGKGFINLRIAIPSLIENIEKYHKALLEDKQNGIL